MSGNRGGQRSGGWAAQRAGGRAAQRVGGWAVQRVGGFLFSAALMLSLPSQALSQGTPMTFSGPMVQGGLAIGQAQPGSQVWVSGKKVRVSPEGVFLVGFGRDAGVTVAIKALAPGGVEETRSLAVKKRTYKVQRINGLPQKKVTPDPKAIKRIRADNASIGRVRRLDTAQSLFTSGFEWPITGRISGVFGSQRILNGKPRSPHNGVDVAAPPGKVIRAPADGIVALIAPDMFFTGQTMMIDHGHGLSSVYAHMSAMLVGEGDTVKKGTPIGKVGSTGRATGPHLHWGASLFGTHLDPALLAGDMKSTK